MGLFTKQLILGLAVSLAFAGSAFADFLLTDFDDETNISNIGTYYYLYSSCSPQGRGPCKVDDVPLLIEGGAGGPDEYGPVSYEAITGNDCYGGKGACAGFKVVLPTYDADAPYYPGFGFGILLTDSDDVGYGDEFKNVTGVRFKYRTTQPSDVKVIFKVETTDNSFDGPYGAIKGDCGKNKSGCDPANAWATTFTATSTWKDTTIKISPVTKVTSEGAQIEKETTTGSAGDLKQFGWWGYSSTFAPEKATKIAWAINSDINAALNGTTVDILIDSVVLVGSFNYVAPDLCKDCIGGTLPTPNKLLSDFEGADYEGETTNYLRNSRGYYWYWYDDTKGGGSSEVSGKIENPTVPGEEIINTEGNGKDGRGAWIEFTKGAAYNNGKANVQSFVGIGVNLADDELETDWLNASAFTGIHFDYKTTANVEYLNVEVTDSYDAIGKAADNDGEVYYTKIPGSAAWKSATIAFNKLVLPSWVKTSGERRGDLRPLDKAKLAAIKFKHEGFPNLGGEIAIDNVYLYGASSWGTPGSVKFLGSNAKVSGLRAVYSRGAVGVNWNAAQSVASGKIQLVNTRGRVVASAPIAAAGSKVSAKLGAGALPTGMYFVRINAKDVNGKKIVQQAPVSIVK